MLDLRTKICIWIIIVGMLNFLSYTIGYTIVGGEAIRGKIYVNPENGKRSYYLDGGQKVSDGAFIYSGVHSISIWVTVGAIMMAMLTLAKDRISDSLREAMMRGRTFCTVLAVLIGICTAGLTFQFIHEFVDHFQHPQQMIVDSHPASQPGIILKGTK